VPPRKFPRRSVGIDFDLDISLGTFFDQFLEILGGLSFGGVDGNDMAELDDHWRRQGGGDGQENGRQAEQDQLDLTHGVTPLFLLDVGVRPPRWRLPSAGQ
jgi:hypothetical protein